MKHDFENDLRKMGELIGVGADWFEVGEAEPLDDGAVRYGIYAKTDEIGKKVSEVLEKAIEALTDEK